MFATIDRAVAATFATIERLPDFFFYGCALAAIFIPAIVAGSAI